MRLKALTTTGHGWEAGSSRHGDYDTTVGIPPSLISRFLYGLVLSNGLCNQGSCSGFSLIFAPVSVVVERV